MIKAEPNILVIWGMETISFHHWAGVYFPNSMATALSDRSDRFNRPFEDIFGNSALISISHAHQLFHWLHITSENMNDGHCWTDRQRPKWMWWESLWRHFRRSAQQHNPADFCLWWECPSLKHQNIKSAASGIVLTEALPGGRWWHWTDDLREQKLKMKNKEKARKAEEQMASNCCYRLESQKKSCQAGFRGYSTARCCRRTFFISSFTFTVMWIYT